MRILWIIGAMVALLGFSAATISPQVIASLSGGRAKREDAVEPKVLETLLGGGRTKRGVRQAIPTLLGGTNREKRAPVDPKVAETLLGRGKRSVNTPVLETLVRGKREPKPTIETKDIKSTLG